MPINSPQDLLIYELSSVYNTEQTLLQGMRSMRKMTQSDRIGKMLDDHFQETEQQISNLQQAFNTLGVQPMQIQCMAAQGLVQDFQNLSGQLKDPQLIDLAILGAWSKAEHLEIAAYRGLTEKVKLLGDQQLASTLSKILSQEEKESQNLIKVGNEFDKNLLSQGQGGNMGGISSMR